MKIGVTDEDGGGSGADYVLPTIFPMKGYSAWWYYK